MFWIQYISDAVRLDVIRIRSNMFWILYVLDLVCFASNTYQIQIVLDLKCSVSNAYVYVCVNTWPIKYILLATKTRNVFALSLKNIGEVERYLALTYICATTLVHASSTLMILGRKWAQYAPIGAHP